MLQRRGQVTAAQVADELEVSERTARRDLDALAMAGVPIYSQRGRGGGWRLAGGGRIDLSGLHADEARALFLLAGPRSDATPEVRSALRKLVRALPEPMRPQAEAAAGAVVVDPTGWDHVHGAPWRPPLLDELEAAVVDGECVQLTYTARAGADSEREVHPLGLATKGRHWYLLASTDDGMRTFRVDRVQRVRRTGRPVVRPDDFELSEHWTAIVEQVDRMRTPVAAHGRASPDAERYLRAVFGRRVTLGEADADADADGTRAFSVRGASVPSIAAEIAGLASMVTIESPEELRTVLHEVGAQLVRTYGGENCEQK